ncbi:MAG: hypothetical protein B7X11_04085, partial [Acidobacteria bacterium 37-65-4]
MPQGPAEERVVVVDTVDYDAGVDPALAGNRKVARSFEVVVSGIARTRLLKFRPLTGSCWICSLWIVVEAEVLATSTIGTSLVTVIDSALPSSCSVKSTVRAEPRFNRTPVRVAVLNPDS